MLLKAQALQQKEEEEELLLANFFRESEQSLLFAARGNEERKVWTSQNRIPVKNWGPQGYGKCNRKYVAAFCRQSEMLTLGVRPTLSDLGGYKPYPKQEKDTLHGRDSRCCLINSLKRASDSSLR